MDVNITEDLNAVNDQLQKLVEELNRVSAARENLMQQIQNLNGVAMYLRGKISPQEEAQMPDMGTPPDVSEEDLDRSVEYPTTEEA